MGVVKFTPNMNSTTEYDGNAFSGERSVDGPVSTCNSRNDDHDIDVLKSRMKLKLGFGVLGHSIPSPEGATAFSIQNGQGITPEKVTNGHELSLSLPNLNETDDSILVHSGYINEKNVRNSLSDIYESRLSPVICSPESSVNSTSCLLSRSPEKRSGSAEVSPNEKQALVKQQCDEHSSRNYKSNIESLDMDGSENRLSAVLENIPLVYIPNTKQLVSLTPKHQSRQTGNGNSLTEKCDKELETVVNLNTDSKDNRPLPVVNGFKDANGEIDSSNAASSSVITSPITNNDTPADLNSLDSYKGRSRRLSSEDSDASSTCKSDRTIIYRPHLNITTQGLKVDSPSLKSADFDEISLSRVSIERDSPKNTLHRTNTTGSLPLGDTSSFSSISSLSTGTDFSASAASYSDDHIEFRNALPEGDTFIDVNLHSRNSFDRPFNVSQDSGIDEKCGHQGAKSKRRGLSGFFTRGLFSRKAKEASDNAGWKLFGRIPPKNAPQKDACRIQEEYQAKLKEEQLIASRAKKSDVEVLSTTALILENRPLGLPSKDPEEELKHKLEYEAIVEAAKKKELKEAKRRKKRMQEQIKHEESLAAALKIWNSEILTNWETMSTSKKAKDLWWLGIPPSVRGRVWQLAIGNDLNLTSELYEICLARAKERFGLLNGSGGDTDSIHSNLECEASREASVELIKLDVSRTFPQLCIFQKGGPYHELLQGLLGAYACYRPDVGYVQGMSFIAAVLLLNMDVDDAFICFANLLNRPCQIAFFRLDEGLMKSYFATYEEFFQENLPKLHAHFEKQGLTPDLYIIDWMFTLYAKSLPLDLASRVWDIFCRDGEEFLFRTALGVLKMYEDILLNMDFIHLAQFLTRLPESISADQLFINIEAIVMNIDKRKFNNVLAAHKDIVIQQQNQEKPDT